MCAWQKLKQTFLSYLELWNRFWFAPTDLIHLSMMRLLLGFHLLVMYSIRYLERDLFFFKEGMVTPEMAKSFYQNFNEPLFFLFPSSNEGIQVIIILHLLGLFIFMLGAGHRFIYFALFLCHLALIQRNHFIVYGADIFANYWLLYMSFTRCDEYLSLKSWWRVKFKKLKSSLNAEVSVRSSDSLSTIGLRLIQLQLCFSYAYTGAEKLKGYQWWDGSALWVVMGNRQLVPFDLSFMTHWPWIVALMTFSVVIWELYFPFLIYLKPTRRFCIFLGFAFHIFTALFMGLYFFSGVMLAAYVVFISPESLRKLSLVISKKINL